MEKQQIFGYNEELMNLLLKSPQVLGLYTFKMLICLPTTTSSLALLY